MRLLATIGFLLLFNHAAAFDCREYESQRFNEDQSSWCKCEDLPKALQAISDFKNLSLTAACNYEIRNLGGEELPIGYFFYRGSQVFTGRMVRQATDEGWGFYLFGEKVAQRPPLYHSSVQLIFSDETLAQRNFNVPDFTEVTSCWEANVKINVTEMEIIVGDDTVEGNHIRKYSVLDVGPYRQCPKDQVNG